jgi:hypothetical protein
MLTVIPIGHREGVWGWVSSELHELSDPSGCARNGMGALGPMLSVLLGAGHATARSPLRGSREMLALAPPETRASARLLGSLFYPQGAMVAASSYA